MKKAGWPLLLLAVLAVIAMLYRSGDGGNAAIPGGTQDSVVSGPGPETRNDLNRNALSLIYSRHARCRMECRQISESEVMEILRTGRINWSKSDMRGQPDPKYALEGSSRDGQEIRVVFANSPRGLVVVTVIDLEKQWKCNCR